MLTTLFKRILETPVDRVKKLVKKGFRFILPRLYVKIVILGFVLAGLYTIFPKLIFCGSYIGSKFCMPYGLFVAMVVSLPGYFIGGNILKFLPGVPIIASTLAVFIVSYIFYLYLGRLIDKLRKGLVSTEEKVKTVIVVSFFILGLLVLSLL